MLRIMARENLRNRDRDVIAQRLTRDEQILNRELEEAAIEYMQEQERAIEIQNELEVMQRSPYPRQYRHSIRNLNLPATDDREGLMLIRQEQSQMRPVELMRERSAVQTFENLSQNSDEEEHMPYSSIRNRVATPNPRHYQERIQQSMMEFEKVIPKIWQEELLHPDNDTPISSALIEECGPLTLMVYHRLFQLSSEYYEFKQLNSIFLTGAACLQKKRRHQLKELRRIRRSDRQRLETEVSIPMTTEHSEPAVLETEQDQRLVIDNNNISAISPEQYNYTNLRSPVQSPISVNQIEKQQSDEMFDQMATSIKIISKMLNFFTFHLQLANKDPASQWRIETIIDNIPSIKQLDYAFSRKFIVKQAVSTK